MIYGVKSHEKYVYHYTRAETAREHILKSRTLRLSTLADTNDPRESKAWEFDLWTSGKHDLGCYQMDKCSVWLSTALKSTARLACFSRDRGPLSGDHMQDILNRGLARTRMWAQYADKHKGVCLVFDKALLIQAVSEHLAPRLCFVGDVAYKDHYVVRKLERHEFMIDVDELESLGTEQYVHAHVQRHHDQLFFEKLEDWRDEVEWRILALGIDEGPLYLPIEQALVGVIHGASIDPVLSDELIVMTEGQQIEHMGLKWKNSCPWYEIGETRWSASDRALLKWKPTTR